MTQVEEMVDTMTGGEYHCSVVEYIHTLLSELLCRETVHLDEGVKFKLYIVLFCNVIVGRLIRCRFWLRHENLLYFHFL